MNSNNFDLENNYNNNNNSYSNQQKANISHNQSQNQNQFNDNNNNYDNNLARNIEDNSIELQRMNLLIENNKKVNKDKVGFYKFLIYSTKAEIHLNSFKGLLYWISLCEIFLYILSILLFISSPKSFYLFWAFTTHLIRGILGIIVLFRIPDSYMCLENLDKYDSSSIESLQRDLTTNYFQILSENENRIKPFLITYFIFTLINFIIDNLIFFYLLSKWEYQEYSLANIFGLLLIIVFFRK
jgi:hypothetical protein